LLLLLFNIPEALLTRIMFPSGTLERKLSPLTLDKIMRILQNLMECLSYFFSSETKFLISSALSHLCKIVPLKNIWVD